MSAFKLQFSLRTLCVVALAASLLLFFLVQERRHAVQKALLTGVQSATHGAKGKCDQFLLATNQGQLLLDSDSNFPDFHEEWYWSDNGKVYIVAVIDLKHQSVTVTIGADAGCPKSLRVQAREFLCEALKEREVPFQLYEGAAPAASR